MADTTNEDAFPGASEKPARNNALDALRAAVTALVVFHHSALTYGGDGTWFYREIAPSQTASSLLLTLFCALNQAWFMGAFFLIAGYFTPPAVDRRGIAGFLRERALRIGVPLLAFGIVLGPLTVALALTAEGKSFAATLLWLWSHLAFIAGPLWFAEALLIFSAVYALLRAAGLAKPREVPFPSNGAMLFAALAVGAAAFLLRLVWPVGVAVASMQFGHFASYIVLFLAGCLGARSRWLERVPVAQAAFWRHIAYAAFPLFPIAAVVAAGRGAAWGPPTGGWNITAAIYALWEPFVAWGVILTVLVRFGARFATLGPFWAKAARRAFLVYIIHSPVLVATALVWRDVAAPALVKFAVTGSVACVLCYLAAGLLLRIPGVARVV